MNHMVCYRCGRRLQRRELLLEKICERCFSSHLSAHDETLSKYLELLGLPAVLFFSNFTLLFASIRFCKMLIMFPHDIFGHTIGEVPHCIYSSTTGSCGETTSCSFCDLRHLPALSRNEERSICTKVDYLRKPEISAQSKVTAQKTGEAILFKVVGRDQEDLLAHPQHRQLGSHVVISVGSCSQF